MANLVPFGVDPTGQARQAEAGDALVDSAGNALGGGGKPTPDAWDVESQTAAVPVLTDSSATVQLLASSVVRVELPAYSTANPFFVFVNNGGADVTIRPVVGSDYVLQGGHVAQLFSNGVDGWSGSSALTITNLGMTNYWFGGNDSTAPSQLFEASGKTTDSLSTTHSGLTQWIMPAACSIRSLGVIGASSNDPEYRIYKNGTLSETTPDNEVLSTIFVHTTFVTTFAIGDKLGVGQNDSSGELGNSRVCLIVDTIGYTAMLDFCGDNALNAFVEVNDNYDTAGNNTVYDPENHAFMIPVAMDLVGIHYDMQLSHGAGGGHVWKNGAFDQGFNPVNGVLEGIDDLTPSAFAVGDTLGLKPYVSGNNPGDCRFQYLFQGSTAVAYYRWGGDAVSINRYKKSFARADASASDSSINASTGVAIPAPASIEAVSALHEVVPVGAAGIVKNNVLSESISIGGSGGVDTNFSTTFSAGDRLDIFNQTTNPPSRDTNYLLAMRY